MEGSLVADDQDQEKTEEPTPKKLEDARKEGDVVSSREVNSWFAIAALLLYLSMILPYFAEGIMETAIAFIERPHVFSINSDNFAPLLTHVWDDVFAYMIIPLGLFLLVGLLSNIIQHGLLYTTKSIQPKLSKISPKAGFKRLFSAKSLMEFAKGIVKIIIVGLIAYFLLASEFSHLDRFVNQDIAVTIADIQWMVILLITFVLAIFSVFAAIDYVYQRYEYMKKHRMTKQQVKDEMKQTFGDPQIKSRIQRIRQERAQKRMMAAVPKADVVITNPTHFAVALAYDGETMNAPTIVAKGQDLIAQQIKKIAKENNVTTVENKPLARALFQFDIDQEIPPEHYHAVAEIIQYVWAIKGKKG